MRNFGLVKKACNAIMYSKKNTRINITENDYVLKKYLAVATTLLQFRSPKQVPRDMLLLTRSLLDAKAMDCSFHTLVLCYFRSCIEMQAAGTLLSALNFIADKILQVRFPNTWKPHLLPCTSNEMTWIRFIQVSLGNSDLTMLGNEIKRYKQKRYWIYCATILEIVLFRNISSLCGWIQRFCVENDPLEYEVQEPLYDNGRIWEVGARLFVQQSNKNAARTLLHTALLCDILYRPTPSNKTDNVIKWQEQIYWNILNVSTMNTLKYGRLRNEWLRRITKKRKNPS